MYDDRRTVEPKESEVNEGNLNREKTVEVRPKLENGKWTFDEVSVTPFSIWIVLVERIIKFFLIHYILILPVPFI